LLPNQKKHDILFLQPSSKSHSSSLSQKDLLELGIVDLFLGSNGRLSGLFAEFAGLFGEHFSATESLGIGVQTDKDSHVLERILSLGKGALDNGLPGGADDGLDLVRVDETGKIGVRHDGSGERVLLLEGGALVGSSPEGIELLKGRLGPDDKAAEVTAGSELEEIERLDGAELNAGNVAHGASWS
jgi:hypothetical protein